MVTAASLPYIEASVPVLREHGVAITRRFYSNMFAAHPDLKNLFNMGNQASGAQQQSLAAAVFAYAANPQHHAHREDIAAAQSTMPNLRVATFYEHGAEQAGDAQPGFMRFAALPPWPVKDAEVYLCGPLGFMRAQWKNLLTAGVPASRLHREVFGPEMLDYLD